MIIDPRTLFHFCMLTVQNQTLDTNILYYRKTPNDTFPFFVTSKVPLVVNFTSTPRDVRNGAREKSASLGRA